MNMTGQYLPGDSLVHKLDSRAKLFALLLMIVSTVITKSILGYILLIIFTGVSIYLSKIKLSIAVGSIKRLISFFIFIFMLNALFYESDNPIFHWHFIYISTDGIIQGANILLRILIIMTLSNLFTLTTPPMEIVNGIETTMIPLKLFHLPVEQMAMIISVAIQFIPTLLEETDTIRKAQIARGALFESKKLTDRAKALGPLIIPTFMSAFKRADDLSMAMESRGYRSAKERTKKEHLSMSNAGYIATALSVLVLCAEITLKIIAK